MNRKKKISVITNGEDLKCPIELKLIAKNNGYFKEQSMVGCILINISNFLEFTEKKSHTLSKKGFFFFFFLVFESQKKKKKRISYKLTKFINNREKIISIFVFWYIVCSINSRAKSFNPNFKSKRLLYFLFPFSFQFFNFSFSIFLFSLAIRKALDEGHHSTSTSGPHISQDISPEITGISPNNGPEVRFFSSPFFLSFLFDPKKKIKKKSIIRKERH